MTINGISIIIQSNAYYVISACKISGEKGGKAKTCQIRRDGWWKKNALRSMATTLFNPTLESFYSLCILITTTHSDKYLNSFWWKMRLRFLFSVNLYIYQHDSNICWNSALANSANIDIKAHTVIQPDMRVSYNTISVISNNKISPRIFMFNNI